MSTPRPAAMTETPEDSSGTPDAPAPPTGDLLSDVIGTVRLTGAVLFRAELTEPCAIGIPEACHLAHVLPGVRTGHVIPFHVVATGSCVIEARDREALSLHGGEAVLLPYGDGHTVRCGHAAPPTPVSRLMPDPPWSDMQVVRCGGPGSTTEIICGFVQCDQLLFDPFLRSLPPVLHARPGGDPAASWLSTTISYTAWAASHPDTGTRCMLPRLTELMFVEVLRHHLQALPAGEVGWLAALRDPVVGVALRWLHASPAEDWTVLRLARAVGVSRTVLADRFTALLEQPPMHYLTRWRMQLAARRLEDTDDTIKSIAAGAGYESEAAFGRAFKRVLGLPPADWRRRQRRGRSLGRPAAG